MLQFLRTDHHDAPWDGDIDAESKAAFRKRLPLHRAASKHPVLQKPAAHAQVKAFVVLLRALPD